MFPTSQGQENKHEPALIRKFQIIEKCIAAILQFLNSNIYQQTHVLSLKDSEVWLKQLSVEFIALTRVLKAHM